MTRRLAGPVLLCLIVITFFWKLTLTRQYTWLASPDVAQMVLPWFQFQTREWHHLRLPLWDPFSWAGHPFLAQAQPGAAYPLNWLLFLMPFDHGWMSWTALNWYYVLTRVLAALTFFWLARDLGLSRRAAGDRRFGLWRGRVPRQRRLAADGERCGVGAAGVSVPVAIGARRATPAERDPVGLLPRCRLAVRPSPDAAFCDARQRVPVDLHLPSRGSIAIAGGNGDDGAGERVPDAADG